jgi:parallel beta-helix repeat protein
MKRIACIILVIALCVSGLFFVKTAYGTTVGGTLSTDTHWTMADSPIFFNGTVTVNSNVTLTIDPGVTVNLGFYSLYISGTLVAVGDTNNEISFTANGNYNYTIYNPTAPLIFSPSSNPWNSATNTGSIVQYANFNSVYLIINSSPKIDNCQLTFSSSVYQAPISIIDGSPIISNNVIVYNKQNSNGYVNNNANSISISDGSAQIINNQFQGTCTDSNSNDISVNSGSPVITNNVFEGQYISNKNNGITINSGNPQISNNQFEGKGYLNGIVASSSASSTVSNNIFTQCAVGIKAQTGGQLTVEGNSFLSGTDGIDILSGASVTITRNLIDSNSGFGINGGGANIDSNTISNNQIGIHNPTGGTISNNNIVGNTENSITAATANIEATNNWWGIADTQTINKTIYDSKIDSTLGTVTFVPFLTNPSQTAPAIPNSTPVVTAVPTQAPTPTPIYVPATPTPTPFQYSQSFIYQANAILNLNTIVTATAIILIVVWLIVILGYSAKRGISKYKSNKDKDKKI